MSTKQPASRKTSFSSTKSGSKGPTSATASGSQSSGSQASASGGSEYAPMSYFPPLVLTPVSQLPMSPRRNSRADAIQPRESLRDPEQYNPDGSLRTMYRIPGFDQSYAQAMQARYIRHRQPVDREKELSVNQIFDKRK